MKRQVRQYIACRDISGLSEIVSRLCEMEDGEIEAELGLGNVQGHMKKM